MAGDSVSEDREGVSGGRCVVSTDKVRVITLSEYDMKQCVDFSVESAKTQQDIEFGQRDTAPRGTREIARDNVIGKMAEVAIAHMLREDFGVRCTVNYDIYPLCKGDDCDLQINGWNIDVKSTRTGRWLLIEADRLRMRKHQTGNNLPDAIFMCRTPWDRDRDSPRGTVELIGAVSLGTLLHARWLPKGAVIPGTNVRLQAANYGIPFSEINGNWGEIIPYMISNRPPDRTAFLIPGA